MFSLLYASVSIPSVNVKRKNVFQVVPCVLFVCIMGGTPLVDLFCYTNEYIWWKLSWLVLGNEKYNPQEAEYSMV